MYIYVHACKSMGVGFRASCHLKVELKVCMVISPLAIILAKYQAVNH